MTGYEPIMLKGERVWRTYTGGKNIGRLHGEAAAEDGHFPEEWMYSVTRAANAGRETITEGLCREAGSGRTLKELIEQAPEAMLGERHIRRWGTDLGVLIKLIDSKERLTVQVHPNREMAQRLFHSPFGKTECWHILKTRDDEESPCIYLGFKEGVERRQWEECFKAQDYPRMLSMLNRLEVKPGETYLVRGGVPHAIGAGCMLLEVQEPTDYTIRVERVTPSGFVIEDSMCHQGLGFERMFDCFLYEGLEMGAARQAYCIRPKDKGKGRKELIGYGDTPCFRMEELTVGDGLAFKGEGEFFCLYVLEGRVAMTSESGEYILDQNSQIFVPACCGKNIIKQIGKIKAKILKIYGPEDERVE